MKNIYVDALHLWLSVSLWEALNTLRSYSAENLLEDVECEHVGVQGTRMGQLQVVLSGQNDEVLLKL